MRFNCGESIRDSTVGAARVPIMTAQDLQSVLVSYMGESIRDSTTCLQEHVFNVDRWDILLERVLTQAFSSFLNIPLLVQLQLLISHRQLSIRVPPNLWPSRGEAEEAKAV